jgi:hypothetical protein
MVLKTEAAGILTASRGNYKQEVLLAAPSGFCEVSTPCNNGGISRQSGPDCALYCIVRCEQESMISEPTDRGHPVRQRAQHASNLSRKNPLGVRAARSGGQDVRDPSTLLIDSAGKVFVVAILP